MESLGRPVRLLSVDDNAFIHTALRRCAAGWPGVDFVGALFSCDALADVMAHLRPDVVLIELQIAGENALDALRAAAGSGAPGRVVVFSIPAGAAAIREALAAGAHGWCCKDSPDEEILRVIRAAGSGAPPFCARAAAILGAPPGAPRFGA